ncbi:MAG: ankyrin repeat domain-containing protein [bacterium]|nr:ankyrin repeat domain-containing protein [bacterium]
MPRREPPTAPQPEAAAPPARLEPPPAPQPEAAAPQPRLAPPPAPKPEAPAAPKPLPPALPKQEPPAVSKPEPPAAPKLEPPAPPKPAPAPPARREEPLLAPKPEERPAAVEPASSQVRPVEPTEQPRPVARAEAVPEASSQVGAAAAAPRPAGARRTAEEVQGVIRRVEHRFLAAMEALAAAHDVDDGVWRESMADLLAVPLLERDEAWRRRRRAGREGLMEQLVGRRKAKEAQRLAHGAAIIGELHSVPHAVVDELTLADFSHEAVALAEGASEEASSQESSGAEASSQGPVRCAREAYRSVFLDLAGRGSGEGPPGAWAVQPAVTPEQERWTEEQWAMDWLRRGGFPDARSVDADGWLALHHAIQATLYWEHAWRVVEGLIGMMDEAGLRAKTRGGRPQGWAALHLCCNGSDRDFRRAGLVASLLRARADVEQRDESGSTPLLRAVGTGVVDVARQLLEARAMVDVANARGVGVLQMAAQSSSTMRRCLVLQ